MSHDVAATAGPVHVAAVQLHGRLHGAAVDETVTARLVDGALMLDRLPPEAGDGTPSRAMRLEHLDGLRRGERSALTLVLRGDELTLTPATAGDVAAFDQLGDAIVRCVYGIPELTRALRAFGAQRGAPGSDHDRFFAPLIAPVRAARDHVACGGTPPWSAATQVDARAIMAAVQTMVAALAAAHVARPGPERRALEAELEEHVEPVIAMLATIDDAAGMLATARDETRAIAWRAWTRALGMSFAALDRAWIAVLPALADPRGGEGRFWRRLLRRGGAGT